ncbi:hypothetical protein [Vibrio alginolyticus]|uniref:hypothetical protein n=1 Tax=Vibrio alginolyticus TaxID=663 RepID=UPI000AB56567|nr:hypothetical protein [Vibrio alginolyticus]
MLKYLTGFFAFIAASQSLAGDDLSLQTGDQVTGKGLFGNGGSNSTIHQQGDSTNFSSSGSATNNKVCYPETSQKLVGYKSESYRADCRRGEHTCTKYRRVPVYKSVTKLKCTEI